MSGENEPEVSKEFTLRSEESGANFKALKVTIVLKPFSTIVSYTLITSSRGLKIRKFNTLSAAAEAYSKVKVK